MPSNPQEKLKNWLWRFALIFFSLYITTLTFEYYLIDWWFEIVGVPFRWLAEQTGMLFFGVNLMGAEEFYSDSLLVFVHVFNLVLIAFVIATIWTVLRHPSATLSMTRFRTLVLTMLRYFVALNLLVYGFSKLYKWQFMLPEPNILYTRVGDMHRDILYWTSMGSSRSYTMFMGVVEIIPAILLLFRRTTLIGAFASVLIMTNVLAVNFGFDITVKLHSTMLLLMSLVILIPGRKRIIALFTGKAVDEWKYPGLTISENRNWINHVMKVAAIAFVLAESHYPYTKTGTYNDDVSERPPMHGAYEVVSFERCCSDATDTLIYGSDDTGLQRFFIHRRGYLITQYADGTLIDLPVEIDTAHQMMVSENSIIYTYVQVNDSDFVFFTPSETMRYNVRKIDWHKMPLMKEEFTLIDEM